MTATLILKSLFFETKNPLLQKIIVDDKEYKYLLEKEIEINFNEIESEIGVKIVSIKLFFKDKDMDEEHFFEIVKDSKIVAYLLPMKGKTVDIILNEKKNFNSKIKNSNSTIANLEIKENRLLIINLNNIYTLYINNENIGDKSLDLRGKSIQISIPSLNENYYFYKNIEPIDYDIFFKVYEKYKVLANNFFLDIKELINNSNTNDFIKNILSDKNLIDGFNTKINFPPKILTEKYNIKEYFNFVSSCCLFYLLSSLKNNKMEENRKFYNFFIDYKNKLEKSKLENYLKCIIITFFKKIRKI